MRSARVLVAVGIAGFLLACSAVAQPAAGEAPKGVVLGTGAVTGFVENMDRTLAFYEEAFGMEVPALPESGARPYNPSNAQLFAMFDIPGAQERHQFARLGNVRFEIMEIRNVAHRTLPLRLQDPGNVTLVFFSRDVGAVLDRAAKAGATVVTAGGAPLMLADGTRAALVRDVDGRFIELRESSSSTPGDAPELTSMRISIAVDDLAHTLAVYTNVLGFTVESDENLGGNGELRALTGLATGEFRRAVMRGPGTSLPIELVEYGGVDRKTHDMRIQDRGAARMQVRADDVEALVAKMKAAGLRVVSQGGRAVPIPPNFLGALVADPNGFFLTVIAPCDGCAPRLVGEAQRPAEAH